jgi:hypothetical protein
MILNTLKIFKAGVYTAEVTNITLDWTDNGSNI